MSVVWNNPTSIDYSKIANIAENLSVCVLLSLMFHESTDPVAASSETWALSAYTLDR
jgi:hypothetical protein